MPEKLTEFFDIRDVGERRHSSARRCSTVLGESSVTCGGAVPCLKNSTWMRIERRDHFRQVEIAPPGKTPRHLCETRSDMGEKRFADTFKQNQ